MYLSDLEKESSYQRKVLKSNKVFRDCKPSSNQLLSSTNDGDIRELFTEVNNRAESIGFYTNSKKCTLSSKDIDTRNTSDDLEVTPIQGKELVNNVRPLSSDYSVSNVVETNNPFHDIDKSSFSELENVTAECNFQLPYLDQICNETISCARAASDNINFTIRENIVEETDSVKEDLIVSNANIVCMIEPYTVISTDSVEISCNNDTISDKPQKAKCNLKAKSSLNSTREKLVLDQSSSAFESTTSAKVSTAKSCQEKSTRLSDCSSITIKVPSYPV